MAFQWRRFQFFDKELLADGSDSPQSPTNLPQQPTSNLFQDFTPSCSTSGRGHLIFGDAKGVIKIINRDLEETKFQAYESNVLHMQQLKKTNILVTIGNDGGIQNTTIKIWRLDKPDADGNPMLARPIKVFSPKFPAVPVTSFSVLEDLSQLALGLGDGSVMLFDGNLLRDRNVKQSLIQGRGKIVVSVHFREPDVPTQPTSSSSDSTPPPPPKNPQPISLFIVTTSNVVTIFTKHPKFPRLEIDAENGCEELAGTCMNDEKRLVVATKDAVFFYEAEEKREAYGFEGSKKIALWFNGYLVLVCENSKNEVGVPVEATGKMKSGATASSSSASLGPKPTPDTLTIYDLKNKFIAFNLKMESIALIVSEYSNLFVITHDKKFYQLTEHDLQSKMETLFKKNLYQIAISLASNSSKDKSYVMDIFQRYGDHLYSKGDYDGSIQQYLETIKYVEPSYVIRKFLDAQRIHNLTRYLQALHEKGRANTDHTTLLLNCYTKLKDVQKLDEFVKQSDGTGLTFDVITAINVCRQANYYDHALYLAKKHSEHELYLKIQIEDVGNFMEALNYISSLPNWSDAERYMKMYGNKFVQIFPVETTKVLMNLCTGWVAVPMVVTPAVGAAAGSTLASTIVPSPSDSSISSLLSPSSVVASSSASPTAPSTQRSNPAEFIHLFVEHPQELEVFLSSFFEPQNSAILLGLATLTPPPSDKVDKADKAVATKEVKNPQTIVCNTLLELYLRQYAAEEKLKGGSEVSLSKSSSSKSTNSYYDKTNNFIKNHYGRYDADHALVLCKMYQFEKGITHLYEKLKLYHEIVQYYMEHNQTNSILDACKKYGEKVSNLWVQALSYFAAQPEPYENEIQQVLRAIKDRKLLPPLMILQILSQNPNKQLSVVKDYIVHSLQEENDLIKADQEEIQRFQMETQTMREEIQRLHTQPITFQGLKCHQCTSGLSLPAVHFLCMHSFHQRCVVDSEQECPKCAQQYRQVRGIRESMKSASTQHDRFFKRLEEEQDGFSVVADYFGRGLFEKQPKQTNGTGGVTTGKLSS